jgi:hypothetical protein
MKRIQALLARLSSRVRHGSQWRLWVLWGLVLWLFMPPPQDSHAACATWEGGPCIDVHPSTGSGERPPRETSDDEPSPGGSGPGCTAMPTRPSDDESSSEPTPVASTPQNASNWASNWRSEDRAVVVGALRGMKDVKLKDWMAANVQFGRFPDDNVSPLSASGSMLRFKDAFFAQRTSPAQRENLLAFEGGKVFYAMMKDVPMDGGQTFERWFMGYYPAHSSVISDMSDAKHNGQPMGTSDLIDAHSAFGHLFRAQALELEKPIGYGKQKDWDAVQQTFKQKLDQVMGGR